MKDYMYIVIINNFVSYYPWLSFEKSNPYWQWVRVSRCKKNSGMTNFADNDAKSRLISSSCKLD